MGDKDGTHSYIKFDDDVVEDKTHSKNDYLTLVQNFYINVSNGRVLIKNLKTDKVFIRCQNECEKMNKNELDIMAVGGVAEINAIKNDKYFRIGDSNFFY